MIDYTEAFLKKSEFEKKFNTTLPFIFHGGESLKYRGNDNLVDLVLLNTKRIGHGLNLVRHPYLIELVKENNICLELCPVSN